MAGQRRPWARVGAAAACAAVLVAAAPAGAATFVVDTTADGPGTCPGTPCTLRGAVDAAMANGNAEDDTITLPAGDFALTEGELFFFNAGSITIAGAGASVTRIRQTGTGRVLHAVAPGGPLRLNDLTVQGGRLPASDALGDGGGIRSIVGLELQRVVVYDNRTDATNVSAGGGGVSASDSDGEVQIIDSTIARNHAAGDGGGLKLNAEQVTIRNSRVFANRAGTGGGGISVVTSGATGGLIEYTAITGNDAFGESAQGGGLTGGGFDGAVLLQRSLVADNHATADGGGWVIGGGLAVTLANATVSGNDVDTGFGAGGITKQAGDQPLTLVHATFAGNSNGSGPLTLLAGGAGAVAMRGTIIDGECIASPSGIDDQGFNVASSSTCGLVAASSAASTDPLLGSLADNGGPTATHAITTASPASARATSLCPLADQRAAGRTPTCDSGAFEVNPSTAPPVPAAGPPPVPDRDGDGIEDADDACPEAAGAGGCPPPPATPPRDDPARDDPTSTPQGPGAVVLADDVARRHAALGVSVAALRGGRLVVVGTTTRVASERVVVALRAAGRTTRLQAVVRRGRFRIRRQLPKAQRRARSGRLTVAYPGDTAVLPARTVLVASRRAAALRLTRVKLGADRTLRVSGRVARAARGRVTLVLEPRAGDVSFTRVRLRVRPRRGRWSVRARVPEGAAAGGQLTVTFTGDAARRIRGIQLSRTVRAR